MFELRLEGMPTIETSKKIELPFSFIDMLRSPWGVRIEIEELYKNGGEINRYLIDNTPLKNNKKYVSCYVGMHYLTPTTLSVPTSDWHCDGSGIPFLADDILHTMVCVGEHISSELRTEFLKEAVTLQVPDEVERMTHVSFRQWITKHACDFGLESVKCEEGVMNTFTSKHLHRVQFATRPHFRFFWKVAESNHLLPSPKEIAYKNNAKVFVGNNGQEILNIEQGSRGIIMRGINFQH